MNELIAVVDDEPDIVELVSLHLRRAGFRVKGMEDAGALFRLMEKDAPDLVVLDLMLPDADGLDVCRLIRREERTSSIPIIMLTARAEELDRVLGLELGADDYVTKPFSPKELVARVKAVLRRRKQGGEEPDRIQFRDLLVIDRQTYTVSVAGRAVDLTSTEFKILLMLAARPGWVFSRQQILEHLWGREKIVLDRTVDVHMKNMRRKLGKAAPFIRSVRGVGYKLEP